jgi:hypothetical protein
MCRASLVALRNETCFASGYHFSDARAGFNFAICFTVA